MNKQQRDLIIVIEWMIKTKIAGLQKDAAAGPNSITPKLLKIKGDSILKPLVTIFQK